MTLDVAFQLLYAHEINASASCFWDAGWTVKLGDELNGWVAVRQFENKDLGQAADWLLAEAKRAYPFLPVGSVH